MSQSVDRLKELLFDSETKSLSELEQKIQSLSLSEAERRAELGRRIDEVFERAGTQDRFMNSVSAVIDTALRKAEIDRHAPLADAMAPLVVRTIKTEIRNSKDELVETLYPMTGRMVQAYVTSAMKDLANDLNRRLDSNPVMLRLRSVMTGKSVAELAMAETQKLTVEEIYLVRRGTGELLGRWPEASDEAGRDHVMSGILAAINDFSTAALSDEGSTLRQIDIGERQLYLRASPLYLLAAKCSGTAPVELETILDDAFLAALEKIQAVGGDDDQIAASSSTGPSLLGSVSQQLEQSVEEKQSEMAAERAGVSPLKLLAWMIGLPLVAWVAWSFYADFRKESAQAIASDVISSTPAIAGYPVRLDVGYLGKTITVSGLVPSPSAREAFVSRLRSTLPSADVRDRLSILPNGLDIIEPEIERVRKELAGLEPEIDRVREEVSGIDPKVATVRDRLARVEPEVAKVAAVTDRVSKLEPEIARVQGSIKALETQIETAVIERLLARASRRLGEAVQSIEGLKAAADTDQSKDRIAGVATLVGQAKAGVEAELKGLKLAPGEAAPGAPAAIGALTGRVEGAVRELEGLIGSPGGAALAQPAKRGQRATLSDAVEDLTSESERLAAHAIAVGQALALKKSLPKPVAPPSIREELESWTEANAIFFGENLQYRQPDRAASALDSLAGLMMKGNHLLRIIGYTDEKGSSSKNSPLSQERADKVKADLIARGIPDYRLTSVGRIDGINISRIAGDNSPNRRVEFEVGFDGEGQE